MCQHCNYGTLQCDVGLYSEDSCGYKLGAAGCGEIPPDHAPTASPSVGPELYCDVGEGNGMAIFQLNYSDEDGDVQAKYWLQISTSADFKDEDIVYDTGVTDGPATIVQVIVLPVSSGQTIKHIHYGESYYWRVKVWQEPRLGQIGEVTSGWAEYLDSVAVPANTYTYPFEHPAPVVKYTPPTNSTLARPASFTDESKCYDNNGDSYLCKDITEPNCVAYAGSAKVESCYEWWFEIPNSVTIPEGVDEYIANHNQNATDKGDSYWQYSKNMRYKTALQVCDDIGCCNLGKEIRVGTSNLPGWKEVTPF